VIPTRRLDVALFFAANPRLRVSFRPGSPLDEDDDEKLPGLATDPPSGEHEGATAISELPADVYIRAAEAAEAREAAAALVEVEAQLELDDDEKARSAAPTGPPVASHQEPSIRIQALRVPRIALDEDDIDGEDVDAFAPTRLHDVLTGAEIGPSRSQEATPPGTSVDPLFLPPNTPAMMAPPSGPAAPDPLAPSSGPRPPTSSHSYGIPPPLQAKHWPEPAFLSSPQAPQPPSGVPWAIGGLLVGLVIVGIIGSIVYALMH